MLEKYFFSQENVKDKYFWIFVTYIVSCVGFFSPTIYLWGEKICLWDEKISNFKRIIGISTIANHDIFKVISNYYIFLVLIGLLFICSIIFVNLLRTKFNYDSNRDCWKIFNYILVLGIGINLISIFNISLGLGIKWQHPSVICLLLAITELFFCIQQTKIGQEKFHQILICSLSFAVIFSLFLCERRFIYSLLFFLLFSFSIFKFYVFSLKNNRLTFCMDTILIASVIGGIITSISIEFNYILISKGLFNVSSNCFFYLLTLILVLVLSFVVSTQRRVKKFFLNYFELFVLFGFSLLSKQMPYFINVSNNEMFELANSSVLISDFLNYGDIPVIQHYGGHMLTRVIEGILYGLITGDFHGAIYSPYGGYLIQTLSIPLSFWFINQIIKDRYTSFIIVLLFPLSSFIPDYYVLGLAVFIFAQKYVKTPTHLHALYFFLISFFICCYRLDLGFAVVLGALLSVIVYTINDSVKKLKNLSICWGIGSIAVLLTWCLLCIYKDVSPLLRLREFLEISDSNQNWGYTFIGSKQDESFVYVYVILPCVLTIFLIYEIIKLFTRIKQSELSFLFVCLILTYLCNVPRTLTRHTLAEHCYPIVISTGFMSICVYIASKIKSRVLILFVILGLIFCVNSWKNRQFFDASLVTNTILNKPADSWEKIKNSTQLEKRIIEDNNILEKKQKLGAILNLFLTENETYLDFICHSNLYSYLGKRSPVYVAQSPIHLSGDFTQEQFVQQIKSNIKNVPIALLPRNYGSIYTTLDGVDNVIRYYKVSEFIYQNYIPLCLAGDYAIWAEKSRYEKYRLIAENYLNKFNSTDNKNRIIDVLSTYGYDSNNTNFHKYNLGYLPYLWGEKDKKDASSNNTIQELSSIEEKTNNSRSLNGNYLKLVIHSENNEEFIAKFGTKDNGSNLDLFEYRFALLKGIHTYLIRVSSDYYWYSCADLYLKNSSSKGSEIKEIKILEGD